MKNENRPSMLCYICRRRFFSYRWRRSLDLRSSATHLIRNFLSELQQFSLQLHAMGGHIIEEIRDRMKNEYMERADMYLSKKWQIISLKHLKKLSTTCTRADCVGQVKFKDELGINTLLATLQEKLCRSSYS